MVRLIGIGRMKALHTLRRYPFNDVTTREAHGGQTPLNH